MRLKNRFLQATCCYRPTGGEDLLIEHDFLRVGHIVKHLKGDPDNLGVVASATGGDARAFLEDSCVWSMGLE